LLVFLPVFRVVATVAMRLLPRLEDKQKKPAPVDEVIPCAFLDEKYLVLRISLCINNFLI
jgi:hypothetical protein